MALRLPKKLWNQAAMETQERRKKPMEATENRKQEV
jgi:hypothetical protein